jgi:glycosyltransferase involved in cell wall biosynthesis
MLHKDYLPALIRTAVSKGVRLIESLCSKPLDCVIVTTSSHYDILNRINSNLVVLHNYPLLSEWTYIPHQEIAKYNKNICYIGNITEERGLTQLITAIECVDCTLLLAGNYEPPSYRDSLRSLPGWAKVIEYGYVNRTVAAEIISRSLIGIVLFLPRPIHYTSLSTKVFEYMAGGIAALVPDFPIWKDTVEADACGVCIDPTDICLISNTLSKMLDNPESTHKMGENGRKLTYSKYNWESQEPLLLAVYSRLVGD